MLSSLLLIFPAIPGTFAAALVAAAADTAVEVSDRQGLFQPALLWTSEWTPSEDGERVIVAYFHMLNKPSHTYSAVYF